MESSLNGRGWWGKSSFRMEHEPQTPRLQDRNTNACAGTLKIDTDEERRHGTCYSRFWGEYSMLDKGKAGSINTSTHLLIYNMLGDPR